MSALGAAMTRRRVLLGGAGLVVGAGAGAVGEAVASATPAAPKVEPPGEDLMAEHGVLKRVLLIYQEAVSRIAGGQPPPAAAIRDGAQIIHDFIESFHEGLEETYVFPRLRAAGRLTSTVDTLLVQHGRGRQITQLLLADAKPATLNSTTARTKISSAMAMFIRMYQPHEAREDTVVFPAYRNLLTPAELEHTGAYFAALQTQQFGPDGFTDTVNSVAAIEQSLGIYDLDQFTPPQTIP